LGTCQRPRLAGIIRTERGRCRFHFRQKAKIVMVYDPNNKPENPYAKTYANFLKQTEGHALTVQLDDGLNRHMRVGAPDTGIWSWRVVTWPGYLATFGDIADGYLFTRIEDMMHFFDRDGHHGYYSDGAPSIDFRYWAEKLSGGRSLEVKKFYPEHFIKILTEHLDEDDHDLSPTVIAEIREEDPAEADRLMQKRQDLLDAARSHSEDERLAHDWLRDDADAREAFGEDAHWDWDFRDYDVHFIFACYAIDKTVQLWRQYEKTPEAIERRKPRITLGSDVTEEHLRAVLEFAERGVSRELGALDHRNSYTEDELATMRERFDNGRKGINGLTAALT